MTIQKSRNSGLLVLSPKMTAMSATTTSTSLEDKIILLSYGTFPWGGWPNSPKLKTVCIITYVSHQKRQRKYEQMKQDVDDCPGEDTIAEVSAAAAGTAQATVGTHDGISHSGMKNLGIGQWKMNFKASLHFKRENHVQRKTKLNQFQNLEVFSKNPLSFSLKNAIKKI